MARTVEPGPTLLTAELCPGKQIFGDSGNVAAATATATLAAATGVITYCTGFEVTAGGATAASVVTATLTDGTWTKSYTFGFPAGAGVAALPLVVEFNPPLAASAENTAITLSVPSGGTGNTHSTASMEGFQL